MGTSAKVLCLTCLPYFLIVLLMEMTEKAVWPAWTWAESYMLPISVSHSPHRHKPAHFSQERTTSIFYLKTIFFFPFYFSSLLSFWITTLKIEAKLCFIQLRRKPPDLKPNLCCWKKWCASPQGVAGTAFFP